MTSSGSLGDESESPRPRAHRRARAFGLALAALVALYGAGWYVLAGRFAEGVRSFLATRPGDGIAFAYADIALGGFPGRIKARVLAPSATIARAQGTWIWRPARVTFSARPWALNRVTLDLSGAHTVAPADASGLPRWKAEVQTLTIEARIADADVTALALRGDGFRLDGRVPGEEFALARLRADWRRAESRSADPRPERGAREYARRDSPPRPDHLQASQSFEAIGEGLRPPPGARLLLAEEIARIALGGEVRGRIEAGPETEAIRRWRDDGGTIELTRIEGRYGALALAGAGTLALDGEFQPVGAFTARIEGFSETLDALREAGIMRGRDALTAKIALTALARREGEGRPYLTLPLSLQERRLYAGPVALLTFPALAW